MTNFDTDLLCLGIIGENDLFSSDAEQLAPEVRLYFSKEYKNDCGKVIFLSAVGDVIIKNPDNLSSDEISFFGLY